MKNVSILFSVIIFLSINLFAQDSTATIDKDIFLAKMKFADEAKLKDKPINDVIAEIGKSFLGTPYVAHTLEKEGDENLIINLRELDCTTFLENAFVLARCVKLGIKDFDEYKKQLTNTRYRAGKIDGYPSRLHYFTEWIFDNCKKHNVIDVSKEIGGVPYNKKVSFMSSHRDAYKQISANDKFYETIKQQEAEINKREHYYIPKDMVKKVESKIKNGYLIAITTEMEGMDIAHVGIAVKMDDGRIHFLHAPLSGAKVQITDVPLYDYLQKIKKDTGIMVLKPVDILK